MTARRAGVAQARMAGAVRRLATGCLVLVGLGCSGGGEGMRSSGSGAVQRPEGKPLAPLPPEQVVDPRKSFVMPHTHGAYRFRFLNEPTWPGDGVSHEDGGFTGTGRLDIKLSLREWESKRAARLEISITNRSEDEWVFPMDDPHGPRVANHHPFDDERAQPRPSYVVYAIAPYRLGLSWAIEFEERKPWIACPAQWRFFGRGPFDGMLRSLKPGATWTFTTQVFFPPEVEVGSMGKDGPFPELAESVWIRAQLPFTAPSLAVADQKSFARMARHSLLAVSNWLPVRVPR